MRRRAVRVIDYERNMAGRLRPYSKAAIIDLDEIEYVEADRVEEYGDVTIVRLRSGKEITVTMPIRELQKELCPAQPDGQWGGE